MSFAPADFTEGQGHLLAPKCIWCVLLKCPVVESFLKLRTDNTSTRVKVMMMFTEQREVWEQNSSRKLGLDTLTESGSQQGKSTCV